ncbi:ribosomal protein S5 domain 2-type protein [Mycena filopes]|nr:ribosomal protein S5 domain 2-type protein [Mycena filopes]
MPYLRPSLPARTPPSWSTFLRRAYTSNSIPNAAHVPDADWPHPVGTSSRLTDRKSIFLAHASILRSPSALPDFLSHLRALPHTNVKRATHCMYAYRAAGVAAESDGGEGGSGDRLARLLRLAGCEDVVVVVWRWYGGVQLGADRWKRISQVAREALDNGNLLVKREEAEGQIKNKNRKKKK